MIDVERSWGNGTNNTGSTGAVGKSGAATLPQTVSRPQRFDLEFKLLQWRWRLTRLTLPEGIQNVLADELIKAMKAPARRPWSSKERPPDLACLRDVQPEHAGRQSRLAAPCLRSSSWGIAPKNPLPDARIRGGRVEEWPIRHAGKTVI